MATGYRDLATARAIDAALEISSDVTVVHIVTADLPGDSHSVWRSWCGDDAKVAVVRSRHVQSMTVNVSPAIEL